MDLNWNNKTHIQTHLRRDIDDGGSSKAGRVRHSERREESREHS